MVPGDQNPVEVLGLATWNGGIAAGRASGSG